MLSVLVLSEMFPNPGNAMAGIFVLEQMRALRRQGVELKVISPTPWIPRLFRSRPRLQKYVSIPSHSTVDGFSVAYPRVPMFPRGRFVYLSGFVYYLWCRRLVRRMLKETRVALIHAHAILPAGFAAVLLGREFKIPVTCTVHGSDINVQPWRNRGNRWATRWALSRVRHLFAVSQALKDSIHDLVGDRLVDVVRNGADPECFHVTPKDEARTRLGLPTTGKLLLFVGNLIPIKNVPVLLKAVAELSRKDVTLCLVGDGELKESLERTARELGILERCIFAGQRQHEEIPIWLSAADCLVVSSQMEGFPTILPEAMLCRAPVIATAVGGIPEVVIDGVTGMLVKPKNACDLARAIDRLLNGSAFAAALVDRAQSFAREKLTWEANARQVISVYEDMLSASSPAVKSSSAASPVLPSL